MCSEAKVHEPKRLCKVVCAASEEGWLLSRVRFDCSTSTSHGSFDVLHAAKRVVIEVCEELCLPELIDSLLRVESSSERRQTLPGYSLAFRL